MEYWDGGGEEGKERGGEVGVKLDWNRKDSQQASEPHRSYQIQESFLNGQSKRKRFVTTVPRTMFRGAAVAERETE